MPFYVLPQPFILISPRYLLLLLLSLPMDARAIFTYNRMCTVEIKVRECSKTPRRSPTVTIAPVAPMAEGCDAIVSGKFELRRMLGARGIVPAFLDFINPRHLSWPGTSKTCMKNSPWNILTLRCRYWEGSLHPGISYVQWYCCWLVLSNVIQIFHFKPSRYDIVLSRILKQ